MVSETVVRIPAQDLEILRVRCNKCGRVVEGTIAAVADALEAGNCRFCSAAFFVPTATIGAFRSLANSIDLIKQANAYAVEFVVKPSKD